MKLEPAELQPLMAALREAPGFLGKREIRPAAARFGGGEIRNGDDTAALPDPDGGYTLFAAEGMLPAFVAAEPWFAGMCAVLTNVSDIAAMGGRPRAIVDVLWAGDQPEHTRQVLDGLAAGAALFGVPIVGGHTGRAGGTPQLCAAVLGKARRLISGFAARPGQQVLACIDLGGAFRGQSANFDAFTTATPRALRAKLEVLPQLAEAGLALAGKDISMAGLVGTLVMLLETSRCGAVLDLAAVPVPECARREPRRWLEAFPSFGYLLAVEPRHVAEVIARFEAVGVHARAIAELTSQRTLWAMYGGERVCHWDFASESLMGFGGTNA